MKDAWGCDLFRGDAELLDDDFLNFFLDGFV